MLEKNNKSSFSTHLKLCSSPPHNFHYCSIVWLMLGFGKPWHTGWSEQNARPPQRPGNCVSAARASQHQASTAIQMLDDFVGWVLILLFICFLHVFFKKNNVQVLNVKTNQVDPKSIKKYHNLWCFKMRVVSSLARETLAGPSCTAPATRARWHHPHRSTSCFPPVLLNVSMWLKYGTWMNLMMIIYKCYIHTKFDLFHLSCELGWLVMNVQMVAQSCMPQHVVCNCVQAHFIGW